MARTARRCTPWSSSRASCADALRVPPGRGRTGPVAPVAATIAAMTPPQDSPVALALEDGAGQVDIRGCKVLVVDDNPQNTELVQAYLESLPVEIATAVDGVDAMAQAERFKPDLILLDVMMPRMSGFEVCQKVKQNPELRDTVVIMVTALHEVGDFERAVECGCDDFLTKPVNKLELVTRVRSLLRVRVLRRMLEDLRRGQG